MKVESFVELDPDSVWAFIARWGTHRQAGVRTPVAVCLLEPLLKGHFDEYFPVVDALARSNRRFADTVTRIWALGEARAPRRAARLKALLAATTPARRRRATPLARSLTPETFATRLARLRNMAQAGNADAWWILGSALDDGEPDGRGGFRVRPDLRGAFDAFSRATRGGHRTAWLSLGYCHDTGRGTRKDPAAARRCYTRCWRATAHPGAASNLGTWYRDRGRLRDAVRWYRRAALFGDGEARLTLGYCLYYGLGVRTNLAAALACWRDLDDTPNITPYGREEAWYLRAVAHVDAGRRTLAASLLMQAAADGDYPEADDLLAQLRAGNTPVPCRCRRRLDRRIRGHARCERHRS